MAFNGMQSFFFFVVLVPCLVLNGYCVFRVCCVLNACMLSVMSSFLLNCTPNLPLGTNKVTQIKSNHSHLHTSNLQRLAALAPELGPLFYKLKYLRMLSREVQRASLWS